MNDGDWSQVLAQRLFEQRVVVLHGRLDDASARGARRGAARRWC